jgi:hypothetical protein
MKNESLKNLAWCEVGKNGKKRGGLHPRHYSFWAWGYDECPICGQILKFDWPVRLEEVKK